MPKVVLLRNRERKASTRLGSSLLVQDTSGVSLVMYPEKWFTLRHNPKIGYSTAGSPSCRFAEAYRIRLVTFKSRTTKAIGSSGRTAMFPSGTFVPLLVYDLVVCVAVPSYPSPNSRYLSNTSLCEMTPSSSRKSARLTTGITGHRSTYRNAISSGWSGCKLGTSSPPNSDPKLSVPLLFAANSNNSCLLTLLHPLGLMRTSKCWNSVRSASRSEEQG